MSKQKKPSYEQLEATVVDLQEKYAWALKQADRVATTHAVAQYAADDTKRELLELRAEVERNKGETLN